MQSQFTAILGRQIRLLVSRTSSSSNAVNAAVLLLREPPGTVCQSMSPGLSANGSPSTSSLWRPRSLFTTQQQQQQHPAPGDNEHIKDIDSEQQQQQQGQYQKSFKEETQEVSKAFLTNSLNMEELWLAAVAGKLKIWSSRALPHLKGKEQDAVERVRTAYLATLTRAATGRILTHRARSQLKQACLAAATYKVLLEVAPDDAEGVEQHIAEAMGGLYTPFMLGGLKLTGWAKRLLLRQSSISQAVDTLHTVARDMEGACHVSVQPLSCSGDSDEEFVDGPPPRMADNASLQADAQIAPQQQQPPEEDPADAAEAAAREHHQQKEWERGAALTVDSCMIAEVLLEEGVPQLLQCFCCQHNLGWLGAYKGLGVAANLEACIGKGDSCCRITVTPA